MMARYINPEKIKLDSLTWLDGDSDILVPLVDVKKAIAQTPAEDVVLRAELAIRSFRDAARIEWLQKEVSKLQKDNAVLEGVVKGYVERMKKDVVEVVRCKDCIYRQALSPAYDYKGRHCMICLNWHRPTKEDGYCNEGIRKEQI